ncbi:transcription antitermination factor NusB [Marinicella litoralis]|uniref:Transcription antitermination protein NusB n=1 Tax=Marinicella litoralis TaxID=644220 RepID=A0A4V3DIS1_9GAMM|nr:transcription antitermination factor NusB [Marinicella litoralis]TDR23431.1 NusB antitermination factor [Marinicella litoralis]
MTNHKKNKRLPEPLARKHRARKRLVQALYQMHYNEMTARVVIEQFLEEQDFDKVDTEFFKSALRYIEANRTEIEATIDPHLGREKKSLGAVEYAVLTMATYELLNHMETPFKVVINEAILMATEFGAEGGHTFVNGVLTQVAASTRKAEINAATGES